MNTRLLIQVLILFIAFILSGILVTAMAESTLSMTSMTCVNGHCTYTGTGPTSYCPYSSCWNYGYNCNYPGCQNQGYYCSPYRTVNYQGYLCEGQYRTYCFRIGGTRSYIEWILNGCGYSEPPVMMSMGTNQISSWRQSSCGADLDLYVYQNRDPCSSCRAERWDTTGSSNAYVGWSNPCYGCYYCVVVYCRSGCGYYDLTCNSYVNNCWYPYTPSGPVMMSSVEQVMSAGTDNTLMVAGSEGFDRSEFIWVGDETDSYGTNTFTNVDGYWQTPSQSWDSSGPYQPWG